MKKKYLNLEGLSLFLDKIKTLLASHTVSLESTEEIVVNKETDEAGGATYKANISQVSTDKLVNGESVLILDCGTASKYISS